MPLPYLVQDNWLLRHSLIFAAGHINTQPGSVLALAACCVHQLTNSYSVLLSYVYPLAEYLCTSVPNDPDEEAVTPVMWQPEAGAGGMELAWLSPSLAETSCCCMCLSQASSLFRRQCLRGASGATGLGENFG